MFLREGSEGELKCYINTYIHTYEYIHTDPPTKWVLEELSLLKKISHKQTTTLHWGIGYSK